MLGFYFPKVLLLLCCSSVDIEGNEELIVSFFVNAEATDLNLKLWRGEGGKATCLCCTMWFSWFPIALQVRGQGNRVHILTWLWISVQIEPLQVEVFEVSKENILNLWRLWGEETSWTQIKDLIEDFNSDVWMFHAVCVHSVVAVHWSWILYKNQGSLTQCETSRRPKEGKTKWSRNPLAEPELINFSLEANLFLFPKEKKAI